MPLDAPTITTTCSLIGFSFIRPLGDVTHRLATQSHRKTDVVNVLVELVVTGRKSGCRGCRPGLKDKTLLCVNPDTKKLVKAFGKIRLLELLKLRHHPSNRYHFCRRSLSISPQRGSEVSDEEVTEYPELCLFCLGNV